MPERRKRITKRVWSFAEDSRSLQLSIDQHMYTEKLPKPGTGPPKKAGRTINQSSHRNGKSSQPEWRNPVMMDNS